MLAGLIHLSGEPTFSEMMGFDHQGTLELSGLFIVYNIAFAFIIGAPLGAWIALKRRGYPPPRWPTVIAILILAPIIGMFAVGKVPSASRDPVYEPYVIVASAFVAGFLGRLLTAFKPSQGRSPDDRP